MCKCIHVQNCIQFKTKSGVVLLHNSYWLESSLCCVYGEQCSYSLIAGGRNDLQDLSFTFRVDSSERATQLRTGYRTGHSASILAFLISFVQPLPIGWCVAAAPVDHRVKNGLMTNRVMFLMNFAYIFLLNSNLKSVANICFYNILLKYINSENVPTHTILGICIRIHVSH